MHGSSYIELYKITPEMRTPQDFNQYVLYMYSISKQNAELLFHYHRIEAKVIFQTC